MADRQAELEAQLAFLEDTVSRLDAALIDQQQQILALQNQVRLLGGEVRVHGERLDAVEPQVEAPPPHY